MRNLFLILIMLSSCTVFAEVEKFTCPEKIDVEQNIKGVGVSGSFSAFNSSGLHRLQTAEILKLKSVQFDVHKGMAPLVHKTTGIGVPEVVEGKNGYKIDYQQDDFDEGDYFFYCIYGDTAATLRVPIDPAYKRCDIEVISADRPNGKIEPTITLTCEK